MARDAAAVALAGLGIGLIISTQLNPIIAGAGPPMALIGIFVLAWPATFIARARGHHGVLLAACWGALLAAPFALVALLSGALGGSVRLLVLGCAGGVFTWLAVKAQNLITRLLPNHRETQAGYMVAALLGAGTLALSVQGLIPRAPSASDQVVAVVEAPLHTPRDRADLLAMLRDHAAQSDLHLDDGTQEWIEFRQNAPADESPFVRNLLTKTIYVSISRGRKNGSAEVLVDDGGHQGRPWLIFLKGDHPELATTARVRLIANIKARWPDARDVPVMSDGAAPLADDLIWTGTAYAVKSKRQSAYEQRGE